MPQILGSTRACLADFWRYVYDADPDSIDSCWLWSGSCDGNGYPMYIGVGARRISAIIDTGDIPGNVSMDCESIKCVNPAHFFRIGKPGRKSPRTGKVNPRNDIEAARQVYHLRNLPDSEIAKQLGTQPVIVAKLRHSIPLFHIQAELLYRKLHKLPIMREPMNATLEFDKK